MKSPASKKETKNFSARTTTAATRIGKTKSWWQRKRNEKMKLGRQQPLPALGLTPDREAVARAKSVSREKNESRPGNRCGTEESNWEQNLSGGAHTAREPKDDVGMKPVVATKTRSGGNERNENRWWRTLTAKSMSYEHLDTLLESKGTQIKHMGEEKNRTPWNKMQNRFF
jgi:hypothetical protein